MGKPVSRSSPKLHEGKGILQSGKTKTKAFFSPLSINVFPGRTEESVEVEEGKKEFFLWPLIYRCVYR